MKLREKMLEIMKEDRNLLKGIIENIDSFKEASHDWRYFLEGWESDLLRAVKRGFQLKEKANADEIALDWAITIRAIDKVVDFRYYSRKYAEVAEREILRTIDEL